jgi:hypothetical protein
LNICKAKISTEQENFKSFSFFFFKKFVARWEESASVGLGEVHPFVPLDAEELDTEVLQKQEKEEEELGILQYLDQLEQVTARFLTRLVLCYSQ